MNRPGTLPSDDAGWDAFVDAAPTGAFMQLSAWAVAKRPGWRAERLVVDGAAGPLGLQVLIRRLAPTPWSVGYAPRGPIGATDDADAVRALTTELAALGRRAGLVEVIVDPEVGPDDPLVRHLRAAGWRPAAALQVDLTRIVDLSVAEEALWGGLRSKWRQYVNLARRDGVTVEEAGAAGLEDFYRIYVETARRAGFVHRDRAAYESVFRAFDAVGRARLLLARLPDGRPAAALIVLACGRKAIEPYGGMTPEGAESRANYLLKWEAMRSSRERGLTAYDMWGLSHAGIAHFKAGFGGEEVRYAGAFSLVLRPGPALAIGLARRVSSIAGRLRQGRVA